MKQRKGKRILAGALAAAMIITAFPEGIIAKAETSDALAIGHPEFKNTEYLKDIYDLENLGVSYGEQDIMMKIYERDLSNGGDSFYMDRVLAREGVANGNAGSNGNDDANTFLTRGRALYMYTSKPSVIGFGGTTAYHQPLSGDMYRITFRSGDTELKTSEDTGKRVNYPSNWVGSYQVGDALQAEVTKFISQENVAVTAVTLQNTSGSEQKIIVGANSSYVENRSEVEVNGAKVPELMGNLMSPSNLTKITARLTGDGFVYSEGNNKTLEREVTIPAGGSVDFKVVMAFTTEEIPESAEDYVRFSELSNLEAIRAQKAEYNLYWAENLPYIDVPNDGVQKAIDYRWWSERFNMLDANIPGYDYQYPVTIEGVLGYNNAIALTQPMHLQDTKWMRNAYLPYGQLLSIGNSSQSSAFLDNPGNRGNWNNHYGQYMAEAGLEAFQVIGGGSELAENLAYYFEHDAKGQLDHYGNHTDYNLIAYQSNYMTGNDADTISMNPATGVGQWKIHGENAYVWAAADAASKMYGLLGNTDKESELRDLADNIQEDILKVLWCEQCQKFETYGVNPTKTLHNSSQPNLVDLTESNNYNYFSVGLVPEDETSVAKYKEALKAFSNGKEFPIFPYYTANQEDNKIVAGSNNFSNINFTVQARLYESALRTYDKKQEYITDDMLALMTEWMGWNIYPDGGDVRYPNNNEFYNMDGRTNENYYRSWIYHNILGNYNYIFIEDMAGIQPRSDEKLELSPIDFSYDHFMVNNLRYHGQDISIVWDKPDGDQYYGDIQEGYSVYINGELAFCLQDLVPVIYDTTTGNLEFPEGEAAVLSKGDTAEIPGAMAVMPDDEVVVDMLKKSGIHNMDNLAEGKSVTPSYTPNEAREAPWAEKHRADGTDPTSKGVNEMIPDPQAVTDGITVNMPFWGNYGSTNETDSLVIDLDAVQTVDMAGLYFYNDRQDGGYSEPGKYTIEYWDGTSWQHVQNQSRTPNAPRGNYNEVKFTAVETNQLRFIFTNKDGHYTAVTEIQAFHEGGERPVTTNTAPQVTVWEDSSKAGNLQTGLAAECIDDGMPYDQSLSYHWEVVSGPEGANIFFGSDSKLETTVAGSIEGSYTVKFVADDGELKTEKELTVELKEADIDQGEDVAVKAVPASDYTAGWERLNGINDPSFEPGSSNVGTNKGWGNWGCAGGTGSTHWVSYTWTDPVTINKGDIYWYDDGGGTRIPRAIDMQYKDSDGQWKDVNILTPYKDVQKKNQYNTIEFDALTTTELRLNMTLSAAGTGIYRFKVYSVPIERIEPVFIATKTGIIPELPEIVDAWTSSGELVSTAVIWDPLTEEQVAVDGTVTVNGINLVSGKFVIATISVRSDMDVAVISTVAPTEISTAVGKMPNLPKTVKVGYNNGAQDNQNVKVIWPEITEEQLAVEGDIKLEGEVEGTTAKAALTIHVISENVDKSELEALIQNARDLNEKDFTSASFEVIKKALEEAERIYADPNAAKEQVAEAADNLKQAIAGKVGLKDQLKQEIAKGKEINKDRYTQESYESFEEVLLEAIAISEDPDADEATVNQAVENLLEAKEKLVKNQEANMILNLNFEKQDNLTTIKDSSKNEFNASSETITEENFVSGVHGDAIQFNGSTSFDIPAGEKLAPGDITLSYWIKRTGELSGDNPILWAKKDSTYNGNGFYTNFPVNERYSSFFVMDGFTGFYVEENPNEFLPLDTWTHIAVTWDSDTKSGNIYKDGQAQEIYLLDIPESITGDTDAVNRMGESGYKGAFTSNLALDEFKIYDSALNPDSIQELYQEFQEPDISMAALQMLVEESQGLDQSLYTEESLELFSQVLQKAEEILTSGASSQKEVDDMTAALQSAKNGLIEKPITNPVDKKELETLLEAARGKKQEEYTGTTWAIFAGALQDAEDVYKLNTVTQEEVDDAVKNLQAAMDSLQEKEEDKADKTKLAEVLEQVQKLNRNEYTEESWFILAEAVEKAQVVMDDPDTSQEDVDKSLNAVSKAMDGLVKKQPIEEQVNLDALKKAIEEAKSRKETEYTSESWKVFAQVLAEAEKLAAQKDVTQESVDEMTGKLLDAMKQLTKKAPPAPSNPSGSNNGGGKNNGKDYGSKTPANTAKTGDTTPIAATMAVAVFAAGVGFILVRVRRKRDKKI